MESGNGWEPKSSRPQRWQKPLYPSLNFPQECAEQKHKDKPEKVKGDHNLDQLMGENVRKTIAPLHSYASPKVGEKKR